MPGIAALIALVFTSLSIQATNVQLQESRQQLRITAQGQITDRLNVAVTHLASASMDVRLGGIYALQRIMRDSPQDQPTVVSVLCAFAREHAPLRRSSPPPTSGPPATDVQAGLTVLGTRDPSHDGAAVIDLHQTQLAGAELAGAQLDDANLFGTDLDDADLGGAHLVHADLRAAYLASPTALSRLPSAEDQNRLRWGAYLANADLRGAEFTGADLRGAEFRGADLKNAVLVNVDARDADFDNADLLGIQFAASLIQRASFEGAFLDGALGEDLPAFGYDLAGAHIKP